jgi:protein-S-isoprenylcysteine O-methyltransferase Ste14
MGSAPVSCSQRVDETVRCSVCGSWSKCWVCPVFRSAIGVLVSLLLIPPLVARMNSEEALLESEFGERYADYRRRTWRLLPFLY